MKEFVERLRASRAFLGVGSRELGRRAGLSEAVVTELETGKVRSVSLCTALALAKALNVRPSWLLCGDGKPEVTRT